MIEEARKLPEYRDKILNRSLLGRSARLGSGPLENKHRYLKARKLVCSTCRVAHSKETRHSAKAWLLHIDRCAKHDLSHDPPATPSRSVSLTHIHLLVAHTADTYAIQDDPSLTQNTLRSTTNTCNTLFRMTRRYGMAPLVQNPHSRLEARHSLQSSKQSTSNSRTVNFACSSQS